MCNYAENTPSLRKSTKGAGRRRRPAPFVEAAAGRLLNDGVFSA